MHFFSTEKKYFPDLLCCLVMPVSCQTTQRATKRGVQDLQSSLLFVLLSGTCRTAWLILQPGGGDFAIASPFPGNSFMIFLQSLHAFVTIASWQSCHPVVTILQLLHGLLATGWWRSCNCFMVILPLGGDDLAIRWWRSYNLVVTILQLLHRLLAIGWVCSINWASCLTLLSWGLPALWLCSGKTRLTCS